MKRKPRPQMPAPPPGPEPRPAAGPLVLMTRETAPDQMAQELAGLDRAPWRRLAARGILAAEGVPLDDLTAFARKAPDRHAQMLAVYGRLAGYTEKLEVAPSAGALAAIALLSDAALQQEVRRALAGARLAPDGGAPHGPPEP